MTNPPAASAWQIPGHDVASRPRPLVMGILNVTPDSFSDGGRHATTEAAIARAWQIARDGADILDVGGESTRPGAQAVPADEELRRVEPVIARLRAEDYPIPISADTSKADVAKRCLRAGAAIVNDVTALRGDARMLSVVRDVGAALVLMHMQGSPRTMQDNPQYVDVVAEVIAFLRERVETAAAAGVPLERIAVDPGIGFGKTLDHNLLLLRAISRIARETGAPVLVGPSRKRFVGQLLGGAPPEERLEGTLAAVAAVADQGAEIVRVHDARETVRFLRVRRAIGILR